MTSTEVSVGPDPLWVGRIYRDTGGEDFLGLRAVQANITDNLLPGITSITPRARYYAFYSWCLSEYAHAHPSGMSLASFIKRREQIFVLANLAWSDASVDNASEHGLLGSTKLGKHWREHSHLEVIPLTGSDYLKANYGGYGRYAAVMRTLGLTRQEEGGATALLLKGQELAAAFATSIESTAYLGDRDRFDEADSIPRRILEEYGERCHLSALREAADRQPTLETLFAFDATDQMPEPAVANMRGSLGIILDMIAQWKKPFGEDQFREVITYGLSSDYPEYQPAPELRTILAHWRMFQLRELYVYALYALWAYFLNWLRLQGPHTFSAFQDHLRKALHLSEGGATLGLSVPHRSLDTWVLSDWVHGLLDASGVAKANLRERCRAFAKQSPSRVREHAVLLILRDTPLDNTAVYVGGAWLLLSILFIRLLGLRQSPSDSAWLWADSGGARRRSLDLFVEEMSDRLASGHNLLDTLSWLYRDYIVSQHTVIALEKWRFRKVNTFHFNYDDGVFEWVQGGRVGFSTARFRQAYDMLWDLGLYRFDRNDERIPRLTRSGRSTLHRVLKSYGRGQ